MSTIFDTEAFFSAINAVRIRQDLTWKEVALRANVNASTLTRIGQGKQPDVNGLAALLHWSGLKAEMFLPNKVANVDPLAKITTIIRTDLALSSNSASLMEDIVTSTYKRLRHQI